MKITFADIFNVVSLLLGCIGIVYLTRNPDTANQTVITSKLYNI